uniref:hypothetical protein n=1 Tax=Achromobacter insuavis TaxID=1287735 RepID=UPI001F13C272
GTPTVCGRRERLVTRNTLRAAPTTTAPPPDVGTNRKPLVTRAQRTRITCKYTNANCGRPRGHNWRPDSSLP